MSYNILSGSIQPNVLYVVAGQQSVTYNANFYLAGQTFRGVSSVTDFTYSGTGTQEVEEVTELRNGNLSFENNYLDQPVYSEVVLLKGVNIGFELNQAEKQLYEMTKIQGFGVEFNDYPSYSFEITETRL